MGNFLLSAFVVYAPYIWVTAVILFAILEALTAQLVSVLFVFGSVGGLITSLLGAPVWMQLVVFLALSLITLVGTRPFVRKITRNKPQETNADRVIGKTAVVVEPIDNLAGRGQVRVLGSVWTARSQNDGITIPMGQNVIVQKIDGVKLIVSYDVRESEGPRR